MSVLLQHRGGGAVRFLLAAVLATAAAPGSVAGYQSSAAGSVRTSTARSVIDDDAAVDAYLRGEIADQGLPGAAVAVIRDGQIDHLAGFGEADSSGRAMTPQTPVLVASLSKGFTALAVMKLVQTGKVDLSAPVQRYLPWFQVANPDDSARITVEELLHHTSGLPGNDALILEQMGDDQDPASLEQGVRALAGIDLRDTPGGSFEYTDLGYNTLGEIAQTVSGQSYADYLQEHVFRPLQIHHTHTTIAAARQDGAAEGYYRWLRTTYRQPRSRRPPRSNHRQPGSPPPRTSHTR